MKTFDSGAGRISEETHGEPGTGNWHNWTWHIKHSITSIEAFEEATGIRFGVGERETLEETIEKFPLSITPYYLSLIDTGDWRNDPIFLQSFPDPRELSVPGINRVFQNNGYRYCGTLINNTWIAGSLESMNIWAKTL